MSAKKKNVYVVYYSMYGHVATMAREICKGLEKAGVNPKLYQIAETLPAEVLEKMHAPPKQADVPTITPADLAQCDGVLFGIPTRFGMVPAQIKAFFDQCGQLWMTGGLYEIIISFFIFNN
jgi:NAD(P)H dehydrogenase (quinone)